MENESKLISFNRHLKDSIVIIRTFKTSILIIPKNPNNKKWYPPTPTIETTLKTARHPHPNKYINNSMPTDRIEYNNKIDGTGNVIN